MLSVTKVGGGGSSEQGGPREGKVLPGPPYSRYKLRTNELIGPLLLRYLTQSTRLSATSTQHMWSRCWLGSARQFSDDMRGEGGSWVGVCVLLALSVF